STPAGRGTDGSGRRPGRDRPPPRPTHVKVAPPPPGKPRPPEAKPPQPEKKQQKLMEIPAELQNRGESITIEQILRQPTPPGRGTPLVPVVGDVAEDDEEGAKGK